MPLIAATRKSAYSLIVRLLDEKGADVNGTTKYGDTPLHLARAPDLITALLDRGADPARVNAHNLPPLMRQIIYRHPDTVARLLQDPRVCATVNMQDDTSHTALHYACMWGTLKKAVAKIHLILQAGANPTLTNKKGQTPMDVVRQRNPTYHAAIALLEQGLADAEKTWLLVKVRRLAVAATSNTVAPSCLHSRPAQGKPLPGVALVPVMRGHNNGEEEEEESRKLRTTLAFMCGVGREGMPRDVFQVVMDLLMPSSDPLTRKNTGAGQPLPQG